MQHHAPATMDSSDEIEEVGEKFFECAETAEQIVIDTNAGEDALFNYVSSRAACEVVRRRLDVGDVMLCSRHGTIIVERKSTLDLVASLGDARLHEQKARMMAAIAADQTGKTVVIYIVEGPIQTWHATIPPRGFPVAQMEAAVIATSVRDSMPVIRCHDSVSVAEAVLYLHKKLALGELDGEAKAQKRAAAGYSGVVFVKKAKNSTPENTWNMMLSTIQGVSAAKAAAIVTVYSTPKQLMNELAAPGGVKRLASVEAGKKKLGPALAARISAVLAR